MASIEKWALAYADRLKWRVFPCRERDKLPAIKKWQERATTDLRQIRQWWAKWPGANIGVAAGPGSGLWVLDVDVTNYDGEQGLYGLIDKLGSLPRTWLQKTGSGGRQYLFRYPEGHDCRNMAGGVTKSGRLRGLAAGVDTRGDGGFIVVPPSVHPLGPQYEWLIAPGETALADLPARWVRKVERRKPFTIPVTMTPLRTLQTIDDQMVRDRVGAVASAGQGTRNDTLNRAAYFLACRARQGMCDWLQAKDMLFQAAIATGLDQREISATLRSAERGAKG